MVKHVDVAVYLAVKDVLEKKFSGGDIVLGLREGGVGLAPIGGMVPAPRRGAVVLELEKLRAPIVGGELAGPSTPDELAEVVAAPPRTRPRHRGSSRRSGRPPPPAAARV